MSSLRWAYAVNQWKPRMTAFVRREQHARAFRTISAVGFGAVELFAGTGRWDNLGRPELIELGHGSLRQFMRFLNECGIDRVSSLFWDPGAPCAEDDWAFRSPLNPADHDAIVASAEPFAQFLNGVGGDRLVVRPVGSAWMLGRLDSDALARVAGVWDRVGEATRAHGVHTVLHFDCLGAVHDRGQIEQLLALCDPERVGVAVDTAELTIAGIDPVAFIRDNGSRIRHVHLKDTRSADNGSQYLQPDAETTMLRGGDERGIERWFFELGTDGGLVDVAGVLSALDEIGYAGWVVVESDGGSDPAELAMLNGWYLRHKLGLELR